MTLQERVELLSDLILERLTAMRLCDRVAKTGRGREWACRLVQSGSGHAHFKTFKAILDYANRLELDDHHLPQHLKVVNTRIREKIKTLGAMRAADIIGHTVAHTQAIARGAETKTSSAALIKLAQDLGVDTNYGPPLVKLKGD